MVGLSWEEQEVVDVLAPEEPFLTLSQGSERERPSAENKAAEKGIMTVEALLCATRGCCGLVAKWLIYWEHESPYAGPVLQRGQHYSAGFSFVQSLYTPILKATSLFLHSFVDIT